MRLRAVPPFTNANNPKIASNPVKPCNHGKVSDRYVTTGRAAEALGVSAVTLQRWAHAGQVTPALTTPGGHFRWDLADLKRQLGMSPTTTESKPVTEPDAPLRPAIVAAIVTSSRGVLVERRHDGRPLWTFPAGEAEPGEAPPTPPSGRPRRRPGCWSR
jgi:hypothetical protein